MYLLCECDSLHLHSFIFFLHEKIYIVYKNMHFFFILVAFSCMMGLIFGSCKDVVGYIFTTDKYVWIS